MRAALTERAAGLSYIFTESNLLNTCSLKKRVRKEIIHAVFVLGLDVHAYTSNESNLFRITFSAATEIYHKMF